MRVRLSKSMVRGRPGSKKAVKKSSLKKQSKKAVNKSSQKKQSKKAVKKSSQEKQSRSRQGLVT